MNAALLNEARKPYAQRMGAGPEQPTVLEGIESVEPVEGGAVVTMSQPTERRGFSLEAISGYVETGVKLFNAGKESGINVNPNGLWDAIKAGASVGGLVTAAVGMPGVGAINGAIAGACMYVVSQWFGGGGTRRWDNAGSGVHYWFTNYAPQSYLDWLDSTGNQGVLASVHQSASGLVAYWLTASNLMLRPPPHAIYNGRFDYDYIADAMYGLDRAGMAAAEAQNPGLKRLWCQNFYQTFGIDYGATIDMWGNGPTGSILYKDRRFVSDEDLDRSRDLPPGSSDTGTTAAGIGLAALAAYFISKSA